MADKPKQSFIIYHDWEIFFKKLSDSLCKELILAIFEHETSGGEITPTVSDEIRIVFDFMLSQLDKSRAKYVEQCAKNKENIAKRWNTTVNDRKQPYTTDTNNTDNDKDKDNDNVKDKDKEKEKDNDKEHSIDDTLMSGKPDGAVAEIIDFMNLVFGSHYKLNGKKTNSLIRSRLREGYTVEDFKSVISKKYAEWAGTEHEKYLRPETLFCADHFEGYLNRVFVKEERKKGPVETAREEWAEWLRQQEQEQQQQEGGDYIDADGVCEADDDSIGFLPEFD